MVIELREVSFLKFYEVFDKDYRMGAYNNVACQQHYIINYIAMFIPCAGYIDKAWSFIMS